MNELLIGARQRLRSRTAPGECLGRGELADAVCAWLWETTGKRYEIDGHYIAKLERGVVRWPSAAYRAGLRHVLKAATDADLGFAPTKRGQTTVEVKAAEGKPGPGLESSLMDAAEESTRFLSFAEGSNVGELTVEQMHIDVRRMASQYLKVPTLPLFTRARALRDQAFTLLGGRQRPKQARELYATAGWSLTLLAWISVDLGRPDTAEDHARTAWACAENADHNGLLAWVRATQHTAAFWQQDYARAAMYAADGLRYATGTAKAYLASAHALDLARDEQRDSARQAIAVAAEETERLEASDEIGGPFVCTRSRAALLQADAYFALKDADSTLRLAADAVAGFENTPEPHRNRGTERMTRTLVAKAQVLRGDLHGAAEALAPVLMTAPEYRVRPLLTIVGDVGTLVTRLDKKSRVGHGILAGVAEFGRRPALTEPPP